MKRFIAALVIFLGAGATTNAASSSFFTFAPDGGSPLRVVAVETPYEIFEPQNDFMNGIDFWIDNEGAEGEALFDVYDENNALLTDAIAAVPHVPAAWGGTRFRVNFPQMRLFSSGPYRLKITSSMPDLRLYEAPRTRLLEHNADYPGNFVWGALELNNMLQETSLKFSLYETSESRPPEVTNASTTMVSSREALVSWNANEPVRGRVLFGPQGQDYTEQSTPPGEYRFCGIEVVPCALRIAVAPGTLYAYTLRVADEWGNETAISDTFVTPAEGTATTPPAPTEAPQPPDEGGPVDQTPPVITNARIIDVGDQWVRLGWDTNEPANSELLIERGVEPITSSIDFIFELSHLLQSDARLIAETSYFATIVSRDPSNNYTSRTFLFTTVASKKSAPQPPAPPTPVQTPTPAGTPPAPEQIVVNAQFFGPVSATTTPGSGSAIIVWEPSAEEPSNGYRVDIFDERHALAGQFFVEAGTHRLELNNLKSGTYTVIIYTNKNGTLERVGVITNLTITKLTFLQRFLYLWYAALMAVFIAAIALYVIQRRRSNPSSNVI